MFKDQNSVLTPVTALKPQVIASDTTTVGPTIDLALFAALTIAFLTGVLTDGAYAVKLFEGDASDMSDEAEVAAADIIGTVPSIAATDDNKEYQFGYKGTKRYVRLKVVSTSTTSGGLVSAVAIKGGPRHAG